MLGDFFFLTFVHVDNALLTSDPSNDASTATGQVFSFGWNSNGQLGDGTKIERNIPVAVDTSDVLNGHNITAIAAGEFHSLVLSS